MTCPLLLFFLFSTAVPRLHAGEKISIVATTSTIASIAKEVAGERAEIHSVTPPKRDVHFVSPTPKDVLKTKKADVFIHGGLDLEMWREPLLAAAGNPRFLGARERSIDVSRGIELLEVPFQISRIEGDIHLYGNPHYWPDPANGKIIAENIAEGLARLYPQFASEFRKNADDFEERLGQKMKEWEQRMAPFRGTPVVTYHKTWSYFARRYGLEIIGYLEPKPGIPPTAKHLARLIHEMKEKKVRLIFRELYQESGTAKKVARETGAVVLTLAQAVGEFEETPDYLAMVEYNIRLIEEALR